MLSTPAFEARILHGSLIQFLKQNSPKVASSVSIASEIKTGLTGAFITSEIRTGLTDFEELTLSMNTGIAHGADGRLMWMTGFASFKVEDARPCADAFLV